MNRRQRIIASLNHQQPDKTPYFMWLNTDTLETMISFTGDSDFEKNIGNCMFDVGQYNLNYRQVQNGLLEDQFGVVWNPDGSAQNKIVSRESFDSYTFPDPKQCLQQTVQDERLKRNPNEFRFLQLGFSLYERAWTLCGMENVLTAMADGDEFMERLLDRILEFNLCWIDQAVSIEVDAVLFGDDWGDQRGVMMGPHLWRKFIKPRFKQMTDAVKEHGKYVFLHSCGKVDSIMPDIIDCGVDVFNPLQPEVMNVVEMKQSFGEQMTFFGGISTQQTLPFGTTEEVRSEVRSLLKTMGKNGGYIAAPSHSVPSDAKPENVLAMIETLQNQ